MSLMVEFKDVPDLIVFIELKVVAHRLTVIRVCQFNPVPVVPGGLRFGCLPNVFSSAGFNQAV